MHILIPDDYQSAISALHCFALLKDHKVTVLNKLNILDALSDVECLVPIRERTNIDAHLLAKMPSLRLISQTGPVGGHIDLDACNAAGVAVMQSQGTPHAPAELTWLLIMSACRRFYEAIEAFNAGKWQINLGSQVRGKKLGIWGFGTIGKIVAEYALAFGMEVQIWGSERALSDARSAGLHPCTTRAEFFATSDVLTLHLRLAAETRGMITMQDLTMMQPDSILVNTCRAELISPGALESALIAGRPGYAAVDVYESEPVYNKQHPLFRLPNVLLTPHLGYVTRQSYEVYFGNAFRNILEFCSGDYSAVLNAAALTLR